MQIGFKSFRQLWHLIWLTVSNAPMPGTWRWRFVKLGGITICPPRDLRSKKFVFIGSDVHWDTVYPEEIEVHNGVHITSGCRFLTHYMTINEKGWVVWHKGKIIIEEYAFIGTNTIITKPVTIGHHSVVGAGSVVTKDIPPCEVWGGIPAKFIKKLNISTNENFIAK